MWLEHINGKPRSIGAVIAKPEWDIFHKNALACPMFIVPVQKPEGYFNMVSQIQDGKYCLMTFLDHYRSNPTEAPPFMVLNFYDDLLKSKELTLLRADLVSPDLSKAEGEAVVRTLREFYGQPALFKKWVETFNLRSREFDFTEFTRANDRPLQFLPRDIRQSGDGSSGTDCALVAVGQPIIDQLQCDDTLIDIDVTIGTAA